MGEIVETGEDFISGVSEISADGDCSHEIKRHLLLEMKAMINLDSILKSRDITLSIKVHIVQAIIFIVVMYGCESWIIKKAEYWRIDALNCVVGEDSWESLAQQGDQTSQSWRNQPWIFPGRTDAEAEAPILWPPDAKSWLIGKDPDAGKHWRQEEKGMTEDEIIGWHHWLNGHEFGWTPGMGDGQGGLACCSSWGHKESDRTEQLNWNELKMIKLLSVWGTEWPLLSTVPY